MECLLFKAAKKEEYHAELDFVLKHYHNDIEASSLKVQLELLPAMLASLPEKPTLLTIKSYTIDLSPAQRICISEVCTLLRLILVIPTTNAISERSASVLRNIPSYWHVAIASQQLVHPSCPQGEDGWFILTSCLNEFVSSRERRLEIFGKF